MSQNVISLALSADQLAEVNKALDMLEKNLTASHSTQLIPHNAAN